MFIENIYLNISLQIISKKLKKSLDKLING